MDLNEVEKRVANVRTTALEAKVHALTDLVVFLTAQRARKFDEPELIIAALSEAIRQSAEAYDPNDGDLLPGHSALIDWADDFEARVRDAL
ncbi:hypothetical protein [Palleronia caenipelagi]|uniref:Uncharacterized protein n=1 Tax=Palleronia caenipelagi TaxID=2489174 RepID=A0A547Q678_9RHOB|nr:hypothetical protein [Palleronia caenipelagi]TRD21888.1 hypothetical protein FEV53_07515 [Palleronia caenipelagi]